MWFLKRKPKKNVVLILTHRLDDATVDLFRSIQNDLPEGFETKILLHDEQGDQSGKNHGMNDHDLIRFNYAGISTLKIPLLRGAIVPGSSHFPLYYFYEKTENQYDYYWLIESDVRFSGNWFDFFSYFENKRKDLVCAHLAVSKTNPKWYWWELKQPNGEIVPKRKCIRSFLPVMRLSNRAIGMLIDRQREGWSGHAEVLVPSLVKFSRMKLLDVGGTGKFTKRTEVNRFYTGANLHRKGILDEGTFRYRPPHDSWGERPNTLYHPVKGIADTQPIDIS